MTHTDNHEAGGSNPAGFACFGILAIAHLTANPGVRKPKQFGRLPVSGRLGLLVLMADSPWLLLRQAREAVDHHRPEEAHRLIEPLIAEGYRKAWRLAREVVKEYLSRAAKLLDQHHTDGAWRDLPRGRSAQYGRKGAGRVPPDALAARIGPGPRSSKPGIPWKWSRPWASCAIAGCTIPTWSASKPPPRSGPWPPSWPIAASSSARSKHSTDSAPRCRAPQPFSIAFVPVWMNDTRASAPPSGISMTPPKPGSGATHWRHRTRC